ncbi:MAG: exo-alpha-sialidase [Lentisphaerae bacterium]|jgi:hypothetical protein|nr:exo-alpha-sialidase [Lentisphaerota bacterium]MBT4820041.1 exo-alpha-sialidase [Lentisphaerota bacterium]MBT5609062.1 exo-alpha-sialidase [Lentisphaerota bacterium]MBT7053843.1 exo-alpha-sialidase [Lentisphaerota bacterium]MBT7842460.1 exo-alpha-sialidase [Lentisphaerota bacterium]
MQRVPLLAQDHTVLFESPDSARVYCYSPGICRLDSGRLVATMDLGGPGMTEWPDPKGIRYGRPVQGKVFTSDDGGVTWQHRADYPFMHQRPFVAGNSVYILGQCHDPMVLRSDDDGDTWSEPSALTDGENWHQAPANVWHDHGCVYAVMEVRVDRGVKGWAVANIAPVLMRGRLDADLTQRENWTFASQLVFEDLFEMDEMDCFGVPFYHTERKRSISRVPGRDCAPIGWLETHVVRITDSDHVWHDPSGRTFHLVSRAHTGGTGYACLSKVVEQGAVAGTGEMVTQLETVPSGKRCLYLPMPGGQMKFHVVYDAEMALYWLLSTQATDSMRKLETLPPDRFNLANNERRRLQLHFSRNMVDWCFAGMVAIGEVEKASRHYASLCIDGDDLVVLSRSGDGRAKSPHDGNLITFHRISGFRGLVY